MRSYVKRCGTLGSAATLLFAVCGSSFGQCSLATVRGSWGFQGRGTAMMSIPGGTAPVPTPFVSLGTIKVGPQGNYTGRGTISIGGQVQDVDFTGAIQVNPDCTATDTGKVGPLEAIGRMVILDNGNEMRELPTTHPLGPVTETATFRRISWGEPQCTADMVRGVYVETPEGISVMSIPGQSQPVPMPFSGLFVDTFQYGGAGSAAGTASLGGTIYSVEFPSFTMTVNSDCTATAPWTAVFPQLGGQKFTGANKYIVLNYGSELLGMEIKDTAGLPITLSNAKRISVTPTR
jgi:hypothetical protein